MLRGHFGGLEYHRGLLDDPVRVDAYDRAIRGVVRPGDVVLDVGTGTGLLAMLAARRGARVHAVESTPMARVARGLVAANGLADRVTVHEADLVSLDPIEPVDVVLGEWMGRLVVDDRMLDAVAAAGRWAKPDARWIPSEVRVHVAPAGGFALPQVTRWKGTILGIDLSDALPYALSSAYALQLPAAALLGPPVEVAAMRPPAVGGIEAEVRLRVERAGVLQVLACWWEAELAPGVTLSTGPGHTTHWGQYLLPVPEIAVSPGDELPVTLEAPPSGDVARWTVGRSPAQSTDTRLGERSGTASPAASGREATLAANARGVEALGRGDPAGAVEAFGAASCAAPEDLAPAVFENLGLAAYNAGDPIAALTAFLRALDGAPGSREQSARFLVQLLRAMGRPEAGAAQTAYESVFGPWRAIG